MFRHFLLSIFLASPALANGTEEGQIIDWPLPAFEEAVRTFPAQEDEGQRQTSIVLRRNNDGHIVARLADTGFGDDSVFGERVTYVLEEQPDGRMLIRDVMMEYSCYRGENPRTWQTGLCP